MRQQIWVILGVLSCLFASGFAMAEENAERWWVVVVKAEPTLCGQTSAGQLLCLHADELSTKGKTSVRRAGTAPANWSFLSGSSSTI